MQEEKNGNNEQKMFSWMNPKLEVRETEKYGGEIRPKFNDGEKIYKKTQEKSKGVFAKEKIKKDEILFVMGGYILTIEDENKLEGEIADKPIEISDCFSIGPRSTKDLKKMPQHYVNHSCNPNAGFKGNIFMVAMKDIDKDEEIVYDYAMVMNSNKKSNSLFKFDCFCKTSSCRKIISEDDWKIPELQKKYKGYFQWFLEEKIKKINKK